jgi:hypothetical protein
MRRAGAATAQVRPGKGPGRRSAPAPRRSRLGLRSHPGPLGCHGPARTPRRGPRSPWPAGRGRAMTDPVATEAGDRSIVPDWPRDVLAPRRGAAGPVRPSRAATLRWTRTSDCRHLGRSARSPQRWIGQSPDRRMHRPIRRASAGGPCRIASLPRLASAAPFAPWTATPALGRDRSPGWQLLRARRVRPPPTRAVPPAG